jgi:hypothetical protein
MSLITFLETSIAFLLGLLLLMLVRSHIASGRTLSEVVKSFLRVVSRPLQAIAIVIAFVALLHIITPSVSATTASIVLFYFSYCSLAILPPWLPTLRLFAIGTVAFIFANIFASVRLLPDGSEGPDAMNVFLLLFFLQLLFFVSLILRLGFKAFTLIRAQRSTHQNAPSR